MSLVRNHRVTGSGVALPARGERTSWDRGWRAVPLVPERVDLRMRGRGRPAMVARRVYRPHRRVHRLAYGAASVSVAAGFGREVESPGDEVGAVVDEVVAAVGVRVDAIGARRSWMSGRWVLALGSGRRVTAFVKIGAPDDDGVRREGEMLAALSARHLHVRVPELLFSAERRGRHVVVTRPMGRRAVHVVDVEAAAAVATCLTAPADGEEPLVHGDLSPWNLWRDGDDLVLIDWEAATPRRRPMWDLAWYVVTAGALGGAWPASRAVDLLASPDGVGAAHLAAVGSDPGSAARSVREALDGISVATSDEVRPYVVSMLDHLATG